MRTIWVQLIFECKLPSKRWPFFKDPVKHCTWRSFQTYESVLVGPIEPKCISLSILVSLFSIYFHFVRSTVSLFKLHDPEAGCEMFLIHSHHSLIFFCNVCSVSSTRIPFCSILHTVTGRQCCCIHLNYITAGCRCKISSYANISYCLKLVFRESSTLQQDCYINNPYQRLMFFSFQYWPNHIMRKGVNSIYFATRGIFSTNFDKILNKWIFFLKKNEEGQYDRQMV